MLSLTHISIHSGDIVAQTRPPELDDPSIAKWLREATRPGLRRNLRDYWPDISSRELWVLTTVRPVPGVTAAYSIHLDVPGMPHGAPLVCGTISTDGHPAAWDHATQIYRIMGMPIKAPYPSRSPWHAVAITPFLVELNPADCHLIGAIENALAWAIVEYHGEGG